MSETETNVDPVAQTKNALFNWLLAQGVAYAVVHYDGSGDSGQIESYDLYAVSGRQIGVPSIEIVITAPAFEQRYETRSGVMQAVTRRVAESQTVAQALDNLVYLATNNYDWANNDGGYGDVYFLVVEPEMLAAQADPDPCDGRHAELLNAIADHDLKARQIYASIEQRVTSTEHFDEVL